MVYQIKDLPSDVLETAETLIILASPDGNQAVEISGLKYGYFVIIERANGETTVSYALSGSTMLRRYVWLTSVLNYKPVVMGNARFYDILLARGVL